MSCDIYFIYSYGKKNVLIFVIICQSLLFNLLSYLYLKISNFWAQCYGVMGQALACNAGIPCGLRFVSWLLHF